MSSLYSLISVQSPVIFNILRPILNTKNDQNYSFYTNRREECPSQKFNLIDQSKVWYMNKFLNWYMNKLCFWKEYTTIEVSNLILFPFFSPLAQTRFVHISNEQSPWFFAWIFFLTSYTPRMSLISRNLQLRHVIYETFTISPPSSNVCNVNIALAKHYYLNIG